MRFSSCRRVAPAIGSKHTAGRVAPASYRRGNSSSFRSRVFNSVMMRVVLVALCCDVWRTAALVFPHTAPTTLRAHRALGPIRARHTDRLVLAAGGGHAHTVESKLKISAANKGKQPWNKGKAHSQQTRDLIGAVHRARKRFSRVRRCLGDQCAAAVVVVVLLWLLLL